MTRLMRFRRGSALSTATRAWLLPVVTGLVIGVAFIGVYVGLQRSPSPVRLPIAAVEGRLAGAEQRALGDRIAVTSVASLSHGEQLVHSGDAVAVTALSGTHRLEVDYAGARGLTESGAAQRLIGGFAARAHLVVDEQDIVPLVPHDRRGLASFYVVFGVTLSSFVLAQGLSGAASRVRLRHRLVAIVAFAAGIGVIAAIIAGPIYGALAAPFPVLSICLALLSAASALTTKAFTSWFGPVGNALAVLVLTTVGNATSGATIGSDLLPMWARAVSPVLPPGAAFRAVSDFGYFGGAHAAGSLGVLAVWLLVALALVLLRPVVQRNRSASPAVPARSAAPKAPLGSSEVLS